MLVQHFLPASSTTRITNSSFFPSSTSSSSSSSFSPSSSSTKNKNTTILSPFFESASTGFQPTTDESIQMNYRDKIPTHVSAWPRKLASVMEFHRQGFSQLNPRFKQQQHRTTATSTKPFQQPFICPVILPSTSRPQPRQQARSKQHQEPLFPATQLNRRSNTAYSKQQQIPSDSNSQYITLANLTKILHVLQTQDKITDHESSTDTSASTTNSAKQRVQQHLQETATRWWKPSRSSDGHSSILAPSSILTQQKPSTPTQLLPLDTSQQQRKESDNLPLLTIVSNSTRHLNILPSSGHTTSKYDESESSTEIQTIISSIVHVPKSGHVARIRQEPLIMQARGMRLRSFDRHQYYNNQNNMNFLQQQRLIRQT